jgi:Cys-tRNA(Pro)/Cys-tRNA(Cys) deacylase
MKTKGIAFLTQNNVNFEVKEYDFKTKGAIYAAQVLNWPLESMIKSIVLLGSSNKFYLALIGGDKEISLKKCSLILNEKNIILASVNDAQRISGYLVGGISPFGFKKEVPILLDKSLKAFEKIAINAGARGVIAFLKTEDLIKLLNPIIKDISQ